MNATSVIRLAILPVNAPKMVEFDTLDLEIEVVVEVELTCVLYQERNALNVTE